MPHISIIIPIYNVNPTFLQQAVASIRAQTYSDYEVLLVDDGSSNGSEELCDNYAAEDERFRVIHKQNGGVSSARNTGLRAATGDWVFFLDADDWIEPDTLAALASVETDSVDLVLFSFWFHQNGKIFDLPLCPSTDEAYHVAGRDQAQVLQCGLIDEDHRQYPSYNGSVWSQFVRRNIIMQQNLFFDESLKQCEDLLWNMNLLEHVQKIGFLNRPLYHYRIDPQSSYHRFNHDLQQQLELINQKLWSFGTSHQKDKCFWDAYDLWLMRIYLRVLRMDLFHLQNPKSNAENSQEWHALLKTMPSLQNLRKSSYKTLYDGRKMYVLFYFFLFVCRSYKMTKFTYDTLHKHDKI